MRLKSLAGSSGWWLPVFLFFCLAILVHSQQTSSKAKPTQHTSQPLKGQKIFATDCSVCHGLDGKGTERGPDIISRPEVQKLSSAELQRIVSDGVPGTGMPPFAQLGGPTISAVVRYLKSLQGKTGPVRLPGDPAKGEAIFFGAGQCSTCHMVRGKGGFLGPDLTTYGQTHTPDQIQATITNPAARETPKKNVTVMAANGERYQGIIRNEDNFSLQLQSPDGSFHFFNKADVKSIDRSQGPIMPTDYATRLTDTQIKDISSYLLKIAEAAPANKHTEKED